MKLIQKSLLKGTQEFELRDDSINVRIKTPFKEKVRSVELAILNPEPVVNGSTLDFHSRVKCGPLLSLHLNKPNPAEFNAFVEAVKEKALAEYNAFAGIKKKAIRAYSQRLTPPFSGLVQIAESTRGRALTMDGKVWEFQYLLTALDSETRAGDEKPYRRKYAHAVTVDQSGIKNLVANNADNHKVDERILELAKFVSEASFPFPSTDIFEYWLLDPEDNSPLAMIFSCSEPEQMAAFPEKTEWTALPAAVMRIERSESELERGDPPVNYQVERMIADRAGFKPRARWFKRHADETDIFPPLMIKEEWPEQNQSDLCRRYIQRQASRLLLLNNLKTDIRKQLEVAAKPYAFEVERFYPFYPEIADQKLMNSALVEARLRRNSKEVDISSVENRRDGVLYQ